MREDLEALEAYRSPQLPARYRMNTNESPFPPPRSLVEQVLAELKQTAFHRYPDQDSRALVEDVATANEHPLEGVWVANGSNEVLLHLFLAFGGPGRRSLTFEPTYPLHTIIARVTGTVTTQVLREPDLGLTAHRVRAALEEHRPDLIVFCSPNNPTGRLEDPDAIAAALEDPHVLVIVDEAYIEFAREGASQIEALERHQNLVITKTFSKAWSLAGARLGYLLAHPWLVERLAKVRLPYHLSAPSQLLGRAALRHADEALGYVSQIKEERGRLEEGLRALGLRPHPSEANFVLFEVPGAHEVWERLLERGVLVRDYSSNESLRSHLRVTATKPEETDAFLSALEEVL